MAHPHPQHSPTADAAASASDQPAPSTPPTDADQRHSAHDAPEPLLARLRRAILGAAALLLAIISLVFSFILAFAVLHSDRSEPGQYLAYVPHPLYAAGAAAFALPALAFAWLKGPARRGRAHARARRGVLVRLAAWAALGGCVWCAAADLGLHRAAARAVGLGPSVNRPGEAGVLTLMHWNTGSMWKDFWPEILAAVPLLPPPDVLVLSNPPKPSRLEGLTDALGAGYSLRFVGDFAVASRFAVLREGSVSLDIPPASARAFPTFLPDASPWQRWAQRLLPLRLPVYPEPGEIAFVELDTREALGRTSVLWLIDLPSDPRIPRARVADLVAPRLRALRSAQGADASAAPHSPAAFPPPDLLVGDCNIPRGSDSLRRIAQAAGITDHAFDQAGSGFRPTWPRARPLLAIDHVFVAPWLRAVRYEARDGGVSDHLFQWAQLQAR
jgi:hypothetical protein